LSNFGVWEFVTPIVPQARERFVNKQFLAHLENAAQRHEAWIESRSRGHVSASQDVLLAKFAAEVRYALNSGGAQETRHQFAITTRQFCSYFRRVGCWKS
jgi:hypothetical protein